LLPQAPQDQSWWTACSLPRSGRRQPASPPICNEKLMSMSVVQYTVKKLSDFSGPSQDDTNQKLFPTRESLVSDIPAGDGKINNLFLLCSMVKRSPLYCMLGLILQTKNTSRIHTWQEKCCVLSISPYLGEGELCPIHQSLSG
jgi:hypothetical protein